MRWFSCKIDAWFEELVNFYITAIYCFFSGFHSYSRYVVWSRDRWHFWDIFKLVFTKTNDFPGFSLIFTKTNDFHILSSRKTRKYQILTCSNSKTTLSLDENKVSRTIYGSSCVHFPGPGSWAKLLNRVNLVSKCQQILCLFAPKSRILMNKTGIILLGPL